MSLTCAQGEKPVDYVPSSFGPNGDNVPPSFGDDSDNLPDNLSDDDYEDLDDSTDDELDENGLRKRPPLDKNNPFKGMSKACTLSLIMFLRECMDKVQSIMGSDLTKYLLKIRALEKDKAELEKENDELKKENDELKKDKAELLDRLNGTNSSGDLSTFSEVGMQQFTPDTSVDMCT